MNTEHYQNAYLIRSRKNDKTVGRLIVEGVCFKTLELPWENNKRGVSCIKDGVYRYFSDYSNNKKRFVIELLDVPDRSQIQIHHAKFLSWLKGCIGVKSRQEEDRIYTLMKSGGYIHVITI